MTKKTRQQDVANKVDGLQAVLEKVVRILSGRDINMRRSVAGVPSIAWTDGADIFFHQARLEAALDGVALRSPEFSNVVQWFKGVSYHELSHILYSPRGTDGIRRRYTNRNGAEQKSLWWSYVALEDQRIEDKFAAKFKPAVDYFQSMIGEFLVKTPAMVQHAHILVHGRRYLPDSLRDKCAAVYAQKFGQDRADDIADAIDLFKGSFFDNVPTSDTWIAVERYMRLTQATLPPNATQPSMDNDPLGEAGGESGAGAIVEGKPDKDKGSDKEKAKASTDNEATFKDKERRKEDAKSGKSKAGDATPNAIADEARGMIEAIEGSGQMSKDVQDIVDAVASGVGGGDGLAGMMAPSTDVAVPALASSMVKRTVQALSPMRLELENEKQFRQTNGQINMRRVMGASPHEVDLFDQTDFEVEEAGGVEACILLDLSYSMSQSMPVISQMMWVCKSAFDKLDIRTTVLGYSDGWNVLYRPSERLPKATYRLYRPIGGTRPLEAIQQAHRLLMRSDRPNRVLVSITDGGWETQDDQIKKEMAELHANGTSSLLICLGGPGNNMVAMHGVHLHETHTQTNVLTDVPKAITKLVGQTMKKVAHNRVA